MEKLERAWEIVSGIGDGILNGFAKGVTGIFGSANARTLKQLRPNVEAIGALEDKYAAMTTEELREQTNLFRKRLASGETVDDILIEAFAVCREGGKRFLGMRHYDVQLIGGMVLHSGAIAEMVTGEGKTLVATLPAYLNAIEGKGVHVVTVNDYLARRDMEWMGPLYMGLGLTVGNIQSGMDPSERQKAYACDITYGTNNEFGFDYLRDNMRIAARDDDRYPKRDQQSQGHLHYAIVDEVDNILIDEARTPLIISGPAEDDITKYSKADRIAKQLKKDIHFEVKEKEHSANLTDAGIREAERLAGVESFYTAGNMQWPHLIDNALKAYHLYKKDVNYVIQKGEIVIVDEFTGRLMEGRHWSDGLHQAVEAKEGVKIKEENQTLATITLQNFFKLYDKIAGMTGTALTEAGEFWKIYGLNVVEIPTNRPLQRVEQCDVIYRTEHEKYVAIANDIEQMNKYDTLELKDGSMIMGTLKKTTDTHYELQLPESKKIEKVPAEKVIKHNGPGRPVLVGTVTIEKSERLSDLLKRRGIKHEVLNAKHHKREAEIVAQAGREGAITIATNMAGRGTDIVLGGNPETMAWALLQDKYPTRLEVPKEEWDTLVKEISEREKMKENGQKVLGLGGLHIIGTERHEARRIDLQLRGRCGRQGDPGSSRFYLSLEDDLMRIFAGEWVKNMLTRLGMKEGEAIENRMVSRRVEGAQKKVEERNFEIRKSLLEYDEVMDEQRKRVYSYRQDILDGVNCRDLISSMLDSQITQRMEIFLDEGYGRESYAAETNRRLNIQLQANDFKGADAEEAARTVHEEATRLAESQILDAIEENLPEHEDESEWNWAALSGWLNKRWNLNLRDRDLKKIGRETIAEVLIAKAHKAIEKVDLEDCNRLLDTDFGVRTACGWLKYKFDVDLPAEEMIKLEPQAFIERAHEEVAEAYKEREVEFPILAAIYRYSEKDRGGQKRFMREELLDWMNARFNANITLNDVKGKQRGELHEFLLSFSRKNNEKACKIAEEAEEKVQDILEQLGAQPAGAEADALREKLLGDLVTWLNENCKSELKTSDLSKLDPIHLKWTVSETVEDHFRPEMRRMERALIIQIIDTAWKEHLLAMDHLKSSVGLRGYAQVDPKVEYKREGMKMFESMWETIGDHVTNLVFKMEELNEDFVGSTWKESEAIHEQASPSSEISQQQRAAINATESDKKIEPIRNRDKRIGRNDPCPCGSGKKYKQCCLRKAV